MTEAMLYHEVCGNRGPYMLMVHGLMSSRVQWQKNIEALSQCCRPVVVELLGHGRSPSPDDPEQYHPDAYLAEFEKIRTALGVDRWFICGQSLGASLTIRYCLAHPEKVFAQVFTNSRSAFSETSTPTKTGAITAMIRSEGQDALARMPVHPAKSRYLDPEIKKALIDDIALLNMTGFANTLQFMAPLTSVRDQVHRNQVPTLMVVGKYDKSFMPLRDYARQHMTCLEEVVLAGGHAVNIDAADGFNAAVCDFMSRHIPFQRTTP